MKKAIWSLILALVLTLTVCANAFAVDALNLMYVMVQEKGILGVTAGTDYVGSNDMHFTAHTENGKLEVVGASVLRNEGTSWFVVLDFPKNVGNDLILETEANALAQLSDQVREIDEGALVLAKSSPGISLEKAGAFKQTLKLKPGETDTAQTAETFSAVMRYIEGNRGSLMPNVVVVLVTPALPKTGFTNAMVNNIEGQITEHNNITTHIITVAQSPENGSKEWREIAENLAEKGSLSVGGTGYATRKLDNKQKDESSIAINRISDAERRKIFLKLDPGTAANIGKELTVTQTIAGSKELVGTGTLTDATFEYWQSTLKGEEPENNPSPPRNSTLLSVAAPEDTSSSGKSSGISTELLIGIIAGAVVLALVIVLLVLNQNKKKRKHVSAAVTYGGGSSSAGQSSGTTVTLTGNNGSVLRGQMKGGKLTIGRDASRGAMLAVPNDGKLSGLHATITRQGSVMTIADNGSTNGTKVNGNRIVAPVVLQQNDSITIGSTTYTITWR